MSDKSNHKFELRQIYRKDRGCCRRKNHKCACYGVIMFNPKDKVNKRMRIYKKRCVNDMYYNYLNNSLDNYDEIFPKISRSGNTRFGRYHGRTICGNDILLKHRVLL